MELKLDTNSIVYRQDLYPRFKPNPSKIQEYAENIERLPPIELNQDNILIDGYHRWKAYETVKVSQIPYFITETKSEHKLEILAAQRNATHGQQLTQDEKRSCALKWFGVIPEDDIKTALSISRSTFDRWTKNKREDQEAQLKQKIYDLWLACETHDGISKITKTPRQTVTRIIADFAQNTHLSKMSNFRDFEQDNSHLKTDNFWDFEVRQFGYTPPELIDNLLYYFTEPNDVFFDPFGGTGTTIDMCIKRQRRYFVSDLSPIPARNDIRTHDITNGLPEALPVPKLVFLDPPYWKQAEGKYSNDATDLSNIDLKMFLSTIGDIARDIKRKWGDNTGYLALITRPLKENGEMIDLSQLCYERISKYLKPKRRIIVPYSTQVYYSADVEKAKQDKEILILTREILVFSNEAVSYTHLTLPTKRIV